MSTQPSNVIEFISARKISLPAEQVSNLNHGSLLPFPKTAYGRNSKAQRALRGPVLPAVDERVKRKSKTGGAAVERLSKAECHARMRERIEAVGQVLNLSRDEIKAAMSLKHEHVGIFARKCGLKLDWLIAGAGCAFRSRGELFELAVKFELRLKVEKSCKRESHRLGTCRDRLAYEKLGADPDNNAHCDAVREANHRAWLKAYEIAGEETGYSEAWDRYNKANKQTNRVAREIFKLPSSSSRLGMLIRFRVIEANDSAFRNLPEEMMMAEIRAFFGRKRGSAQ